MPAMGAAGEVGGASRINQRTPERFRRNIRLQRQVLGGQHALGVKRQATVQGTVDALLFAIAEKDHNVAVKKIALRIEGQTGIGSKITGVGALGGGKGQVLANPDRTAVVR